MHPKKVLVINILVFFIVLLLHVSRLFFGWTAMIGGVFIQLWASYIAVVLSLILIYINYKTLRSLK